MWPGVRILEDIKTELEGCGKRREYRISIYEETLGVKASFSTQTVVPLESITCGE